MAIAQQTASPPVATTGGRRRLRKGPPRTLILASLFTAAVATAPLWYLLAKAVGAGWDRVLEILARPGVLEAAASSAALTLTVGGLAIVLGTATAWLVGRTSLPGRRTWSVVAILPLAVPSYVAAYSWVSLVPGMRGFWAAVLVLTLATMPYVVLPVLAALRQGEAGVEEAARSAGAGGWRVFRTVTLPAIWPAAAAGGLLAMLYTLAEFGTVAIFQVDALTRDIFLSFSAAFDPATAVVQSIALVALAVVLVLGERWARGSYHRCRVSTAAPRPAATTMLSGPATAGAVLGLLDSIEEREKQGMV